MCSPFQISKGIYNKIFCFRPEIISRTKEFFDFYTLITHFVILKTPENVDEPNRRLADLRSLRKI
ncbi:hypothetical protein EFP84_15710 [Leptospira kmetyi]|uniref:Uncharacterized protein n=1 Tax=Leptospira kmetyi TaxID=408139 RepID=A0AAD0XRF6_9LEPT|nr:hypothetical protein EFP84_15710 [Leptospira kmetyi]